MVFEFKYGDKVQHAQHDNAVLTYIGRSTQGKYIVEGGTGAIFAWQTPPYPYVKPRPKNKVNVGDTFKRTHAGESFLVSRFVVWGFDSELGMATGISRSATMPKGSWQEDGIRVEALEDSSKWEKI